MALTDIDLTKYSVDQVNEIAQTPGPLGAQARQFLNRGGRPLGSGPVLSVPKTKGDLAYAALTPEQKVTVDQQTIAADSTVKVERAVAALAQATAAVAVAATAAQAVITEAAPVEGVDTSALEAAVAAVQPVVADPTPTPAPVPADPTPADPTPVPNPGPPA